MKYHIQESLYSKELNTRGSCYPTVLACILDLELKDVPNFHLFYWNEQEKENIKKHVTDEKEYSLVHNHWWNTLKWWLAAKGYKETYIDNEYYEKFLSENKDVPYMVSGISKRGVGHVVVYMNGEMIHDPHPSKEGLVTLNEDGAYSYLQKI